jgi:hypothetical protein
MKCGIEWVVTGWRNWSENGVVEVMKMMEMMK